MAEADPRKTFNVHDAKSNLSRLMDRARAGEEIILSKAGEPWVRMVPLASEVKRDRQPGGLTLTGPIDWDAFHEPLDEEDLAFIDDRPPALRR